MRLVAASLVTLLLLGCASGDQPAKEEGDPAPAEGSKFEGPRVLFLLTSHGELGDTGKPTGAYLGEISHAHEVFVKGGCVIDWASPKGGKVPLDGLDREDPIDEAFLAGPAAKQLGTTKKAADVNATDYVAIYIPGGHGTMFDLPGDPVVAGLSAAIYDKGGIVASVCHGPAGLLDVKLKDGKYLLEGKRVTAFTNEEEAAVELTAVMPFLLEDRLQERGASFAGVPAWQPNVVVSERLVTGQNPASAAGVAEKTLELIRSRP